MKDNFFKVAERIFYVILPLTIICPVWMLDYFHSGDGAAHLYCGHVLSDLLFNTETVFSQYFNLHLLPVPNALVQFILALLLQLVSASTADKIVVTLIIILLYAGYTYLVRILAGEKRFPSAILFLIFCFPLKMGLYSLLAGFGMMMFASGYYIKHYRNFSVLHVFCFSLLLVLTWLCHLFACASLLLLLFIYEIMKLSIQLRNRAPFSIYIKQRAHVLLSLIPVLLLAVSFSGVALEATPVKFAGINTLLEWMRNFTVMYFFGSDEEIIVRRLFYLLTLSSVLFYILSVRKQKNNNHSFLLLSVSTVMLLYFCMPINFFSGGLINLRLSYLSLILVCIFIDVMPGNKWLMSTRTLIIAFAVILISKSAYHHLLPFSNRLAELMQAAKHIEKGSVVLPLNYSPQNFEYDFSLYLSCDNDVVVLDNAEAATPNGLIIWKENIWKPKLIGNYLESSNPGIHIHEYEKITGVDIDYIFAWRKENDNHVPPDSSYHEVFSTAMERGILFKKN
jgi:hypothetical protein